MDRNSGSRLVQMQARFQQKQIAEREMKIASLYEAQQARALGRVRQSPTSTNGANTAGSSPPSHAPVPHGKVRQMFEERRTKAGIDKSYPLQPIHNVERAAPRRNLPNGYSKVTSTTKHSVTEKKTTTLVTNGVSHSVRKSQKVENIKYGSGDVNHNHEPDMNSITHNNNKSSHRENGFAEGLDVVDQGGAYRLEDETFPEALAPTPTPRSPERRVTTPKRPPRKSPPLQTNSSKQRLAKEPMPPPRRVTSENAVSEQKKPRGVMQRTNKTILKNNSSSANAVKTNAITAATASSPSNVSKGGEGDACAVCGRRFAPDRLQKHEEICRKAQNKKRKPFDALKHRLAGTEAEPFLNKLRKPQPTAKKSLNNDWRQKHEDFIRAIRAAKQVQDHLNAGGKLSDLPPPPPSENPDYIQCPHCSRRFNQAAAERHIPKCASYQYNKPKPQAGKRR